MKPKPDANSHVNSVYGWTDCVEILLDHKADRTVRSRAGFNAFISAAEFGNLDVLTQLVRYPPPSGQKWKNYGKIKPELGRELTSNTCLTEALKHGAEFSAGEWREFGINDLRHGDFIKSGDDYFKPADSIDAYLDLVYSQTKDPGGHSSGWTAMHLAARNGHLAVVKELWNMGGAKLLAMTRDDGRTPLMSAVVNGDNGGRKDIIEFFIEKNPALMEFKHMHGHGDGGGKAEHILTMHDRNGCTCLHIAAESNQIQMLQYLIMRMYQTLGEDATVDCLLRQDTREMTCLHRAIVAKNTDVFKMLTDPKTYETKASDGKDVCKKMMRVVCFNGRTCLHLAAGLGKRKIVQHILQKVEELDMPELVRMLQRDGRTAAHSAANFGHLDVLELLHASKHGSSSAPDSQALISIEDHDGWTPLHWAADSMKNPEDHPGATDAHAVFEAADARAKSSLSVLGLKWKEIGMQWPAAGPTGESEIFNEALAQKLPKQCIFTREEWDGFKVAEQLKPSSFIKAANGVYYMPAHKTQNTVLGVVRFLCTEMKDTDFLFKRERQVRSEGSPSYWKVEAMSTNFHLTALQGRTALHLASRFSPTELIELLLQMAGDRVQQLLMSQRKDGLLPAHGAARKGRCDVLQMIYRYGGLEALLSPSPDTASCLFEALAFDGLKPGRKKAAARVTRFLLGVGEDSPAGARLSRDEFLKGLISQKLTVKQEEHKGADGQVERGKMFPKSVGSTVGCSVMHMLAAANFQPADVNGKELVDLVYQLAEKHHGNGGGRRMMIDSDADGWTPLHWAIAGAKVMWSSNFHSSHLTIPDALALGSSTRLQTLDMFCKYADNGGRDLLWKADNCGILPLHLAVAINSVDLVIAIIQRVSKKSGQSAGECSKDDQFDTEGDVLKMLEVTRDSAARMLCSQTGYALQASKNSVE